jgi:hypothetical protein
MDKINTNQIISMDKSKYLLKFFYSKFNLFNKNLKAFKILNIIWKCSHLIKI